MFLNLETSKKVEKTASTKTQTLALIFLSGFSGMFVLPAEQILKRENWSTKSVWQKFYIIRLLKRVKPLRRLF